MIDLYNPALTKKDAVVFENTENANASTAQVALVRQANGKIAYMIRDKDTKAMEPFYPLSVETGLWDSRLQNTQANLNGALSHIWDKPRTGWADVFQRIADTGANIVQVTINWVNWEPSNDGGFDFSFCDEIVNEAAAKGLKTIFVIFFHYQMNFISPEYDDVWFYHIDDREEEGKTKNYGIQWGKLPGKTERYTSVAEARPFAGQRPEIYPEYWNPKVYDRMMKAVTGLAEHYKDSPNVVGYQLGNEEGFCGTEEDGSDGNPYYQMMFDKWKLETGKTNEGEFRKATTHGIWKALNNAVHKVDPYKPTTTNLQSGIPEKSGTFNWAWGQGPDFYYTVDMVGAMFYGGSENMYKNLDKVYPNMATELPILFPSEISTDIRRQGIYVSETLERGGQGYGIYCFGELYGRNNPNDWRGYWGEPNERHTFTSNLFGMINQSMDYIYYGIPVKEVSKAKNVYLSKGNQAEAELRISTLEKNEKESLGIIYFKSESVTDATTVNTEIAVKELGNYSVTILNSNGTTETKEIQITGNGTYTLPVEMNRTEVVFLKVKQKTATGKSLIINDSEIGSGMNQFQYNNHMWSYYFKENNIGYANVMENDVHWSPVQSNLSANFTFYGTALDLKVFHNNTNIHQFTVAIDGKAPQTYQMPQGVAAFASGWVSIAQGLENTKHMAVITRVAGTTGQFGIDGARILYEGDLPTENPSATRDVIINDSDVGNGMNQVQYSTTPVEITSTSDNGGNQEATKAAEGWVRVLKSDKINSGWVTTTKPDAYYEIKFYWSDIKIFSAKRPYLGTTQNQLGTPEIILDGKVLETTGYDLQNPGGLTDTINTTRGQLSYFPLEVLNIHASETSAVHTLRILSKNGQQRFDHALVTSTPYIPATALTLDKAEETVEVGGALTLRATIAPEDASIKQVTWDSSNKTVATVSGTGVVTALAAGTTNITATIGEYNATCAVTVTTSVDKKARLKEAMATAKTYKKETYTEEPFGNLETAIAVAQGIIDKATATDQEIADSIKRLESAIQELALKPVVSKEGWIMEDGISRYYKNNEVVANKWVQEANSTWRYAGKEGVMALKWAKVSNSWYYFDSKSGLMKTGWLKDGASWYYLASDGKMKTGWLKDGTSWYYLESSGKMKTGWLKDGTSWYYLESSGKMKTGWLKDGTSWYYLASSGKMKTGWLKDGASWYYLASSGKMQTGWFRSGNQWYYLKANGVMATGWTFDGKKTYQFGDPSGVWTGQVK